MGLVVDLFAGGGGASIGLERALGRSIDIAINHDATALAVHAANHPNTEHFEADIWEVKPIEATRGQPVDVLWASPACFPAGTLVLTQEGYRPIETVKVGDRVLTHQLRWKRVTDTMRTRRELLEIRGHGHPGLRVSGEHPFLTRQRSRVWNNSIRRYEHSYASSEWTEARNLKRGHYWAAPCSFPSLPIPPIGGRGMAVDVRLLWLAGRYVGDGWTRLTSKRAELAIVCGKHEKDSLRNMLAQWPRKGSRSTGGELSWCERENRTAWQFTASHRGLVEWLRKEFGHGAATKRVPGWLLGAPPELRQAFLDGYLSADGHHTESFQELSTISGALAYGAKAIANSLGKSVAIYRQQNRSVIEGRAVNAKPIYLLRWRHQVDVKHLQTLRESDLEWCPVRESFNTGTEAEVFNITVEQDESYVAEGVIVHNCTHFSVAKGGRNPLSATIRSLAWVVTRWAKEVRPRVIFVENVPEFQGWGPLGPDRRPCPDRKGKTFRSWVTRLRRMGYAVEWKVLDSANYGAPTRRRRLFVVARCDGAPIVWPAATHGKGLAPFRTAAECIDWSIPCPSIFERERPLAAKTMWRIAEGIRRYVINAAQPFIVKVNHGGASHSCESLDAPLSTVTATQRGHAIVAPVFATIDQQGAQRGDTGPEEPLPTIVTKNRHVVVAPTLIQTGYGEREGQRARVPGLHKPLGTIVNGQKHALVSAVLAESEPVSSVREEHESDRCNPEDDRDLCDRGPSRRDDLEAQESERDASAQSKEGGNAQQAWLSDAQGQHELGSVSDGRASGSVDGSPLGDTSGDGHQPQGRVPHQQSPGQLGGCDSEREHQARISGARKESAECDADRGASEDRSESAGVAAAGHELRRNRESAGSVSDHGVPRSELIAAWLSKHFGGVVGQDLFTPASTVTSRDHHSLTAASLVKLRGQCNGASMDEPMPAITAQGMHVAEVRAFLTAYYGNDQQGQSLFDPARTLTTKDRLGLVTVEGDEYQIVDIGMRMLEPHELLRAQFGEHAERYDMSAARTKSDKVRLIGNSVVPHMSEALARANCGELELVEVAS